MMNTTTDLKAIKLSTRGGKYAIALYVEEDGTYTVRSYKDARPVGASCGIKTYELGILKLKEFRALDSVDGIKYVRHEELSFKDGWRDVTKGSQLTWVGGTL